MGDLGPFAQVEETVRQVFPRPAGFEKNHIFCKILALSTMKVYQNFLLVILALAASLSQVSCSRSDAAVQNGQALFKGYGCATCHKVGNVGGNLGPDLTYIGFRKSPEWLDLWLKDPQAWKHNTLMPNFYLKDDTRKALVAYLSSLKGEQYKENPPWNAPELMEDPVKRGEVIFKQAGCVGCHGNAGAGKFPNNNVVGGQIPALKSVADGYSKEELKEKIHKGVPMSAKADANGPDPMIHMPRWGDVLKDEELDALVEYLYSLRPPKAEGEEW